MAGDFPYERIRNPAALSRYGGWEEHVYADFVALRSGAMSRSSFDARYRYTRAILTLDFTGFTVAAMHGGSLDALLRIFDAQTVCLPVLETHGAEFVRAFADDLVALFEAPGSALDAALEIHARVAAFNESNAAGTDPPACSVGIGFGAVYAIGPNRAMGDEMNRASKLGEDTARGGETLVTDGARDALVARTDLRFVEQSNDDLIFPFYRVERL